MLADLNRDRGWDDAPPDPVSKPPIGLTSRFQFVPQEVMARLRARIIGQDQALDAVESMLNLVKADLGDPRRPLSVALFLGPTGVGKTEIIRVLAEAIHGSADACCRIDMNTLAQDHYAAAITGAPPGYVGSREGTTLLDLELIQGSFGRPGIVLFDEIEKAGKEVVRSLLNVFDHGRLTLTSGARTIDFRNAMIFMTSNLAAREFQHYEDGLRWGWRRLMHVSDSARRRRLQRITDAALHRSFDPEFINRIDRVILFNSLGPETSDAIIDLEIGRLNARLSRTGWTVSLDPAARDWLARQGHDQRFGARAIARIFRREVTAALAEVMVQSLGVAVGEPGCSLIGRLEVDRIRFHSGAGPF